MTAELLITNLTSLFPSTSQYKLKSSQKEKVRQFISLTHTGEKTAICCLSLHDWKLDVATDSYYSNPVYYTRDNQNSAAGASSAASYKSNNQSERKKAEQFFNKYKGKSGHPERGPISDVPAFEQCA